MRLGTVIGLGYFPPFALTLPSLSRTWTAVPLFRFPFSLPHCFLWLLFMSLGKLIPPFPFLTSLSRPLSLFLCCVKCVVLCCAYSCLKCNTLAFYGTERVITVRRNSIFPQKYWQYCLRYILRVTRNERHSNATFCHNLSHQHCNDNRAIRPLEWTRHKNHKVQTLKAGTFFRTQWRAKR